MPIIACEKQKLVALPPDASERTVKKAFLRCLRWFNRSNKRQQRDDQYPYRYEDRPESGTKRDAEKKITT
jgi:hypothetical protein